MKIIIKQQPIKIGDSFYLLIPSEYIKVFDLNINDTLTYSIDKEA